MASGPGPTSSEPAEVYPVSEHPGAELVFGICYALGTDVEPVLEALKDYIRRYNYKPEVVRISDYLRNLKLDLEPRGDREADRMHYLIDAGNKAREEAGRNGEEEHNDFLALAAVAKIAETRSVGSDGSREPHANTIHIIRSLKRPEEVERLRHIYREGFYLISIFASEKERKEFLTVHKNLSENEANKLIARDIEESDERWGQRTQKTFHLADAFVQLGEKKYEAELERFLDLVFCERFISPTMDEYGMFLATAAAVRSSQPGRQVGAAILNDTKDVLAVGCNEVPRPGGGSYSEGDDDDARDHRLRKDSNDEAKREIEEDILRRLAPPLDRDKRPENLEGTLERTKLFDITEYGRAVHGEMDAILACARSGTCPRGAVLYVTTFPCHTCARHIIGAGIKRVVYIEPYPKSRAGKLHGEAIALGEAAEPEGHKIPFVPFVGVGPRRYLDLFSMELGSGSHRVRKIDGQLLVDFDRSKVGGPRVAMMPTSYQEREELAVKEIHDTMERLEGNLLWR